MNKIYDILSSIISRLKGVEKKVDGGSSSGIEVSDTEPTNENTVLWIDSDEEETVNLYTAEEIDAMFGGGGSSGSGGEWTLSASFTLENDVSNIEWYGDTPVNEMFVVFNGCVNNEANDLANGVSNTYVRLVATDGTRSSNTWTNKTLFYIRNGASFSSVLHLTRKGPYVKSHGMLTSGTNGGEVMATYNHFSVIPWDELAGFIVAFNTAEHRAKAGMKVEIYTR